MSAADITARIMNQFRDAEIEKHSTILLGAGASISSGLPDWNSLVTRLLIKSGAANEDTAKLLVKKEDPNIVAEAALERSKEAVQEISEKEIQEISKRVIQEISKKTALENSEKMVQEISKEIVQKHYESEWKSKWEEAIRETLYERTLPDLEPSALILATVGHYLEDPDNTSLVTLNFDTLIEEAFPEHEKVLPPTTTRAEKPGQHTVHHLHGVVTRDKAKGEAKDEDKGVVLTFNDFMSLIRNPNSWQFNYLQSALNKGSLIIAGTSFRDADVRLWLHEVFEKQTDGCGKAFILLTREGLEVSKEQFDLMKQALTDQWKAIGIEAILLQDYTDAAQIIRELRHFEKGHYESPQQRCRNLYLAHDRNFKKLQQQYVKELSKDAEIMTRAFSEDGFKMDNINLSLWLSNGRNHIVRWATGDEIYDTTENLLRHETGHDSTSVAGRALGEETFLLHELKRPPLSDKESIRANSLVAFVGEEVMIAREVFPDFPKKYVIAAPLTIHYSDLPPFTSAVLTIELPYFTDSLNPENSRQIWAETVPFIANNWIRRLEKVFSARN